MNPAVDEHGVRAAQPQVMDQLIGGIEEPMPVDEYSEVRPPPDRFGAGARDNFPSGFQESNWGRAAAAGGDGGLNLGSTTSAADLERAIAASL